MKVCIEPGCTRTNIHARGYCDPHYSHYQRRGCFLGVPTCRIAGECCVEGCDRVARRRGYCQAHHDRIRLRGDARPDIPLPPLPRCSIEGCENENHARSVCVLHYHRLFRYGDPHWLRPPRPKRLCTVDGCDRPHVGRGYCQRHYERLRKYGDPEYQPWLRGDEIVDLAWCGYSLPRIQDRLGITADAIKKALQRVDRMDVWEKFKRSAA